MLGSATVGLQMVRACAAILQQITLVDKVVAS